MAAPINRAVNELPHRNLTTRALHSLDWVVPGQWENVVGWENVIKHVLGKDDEELVQQVGDRAIRLFSDRKQGYQQALWLYHTVDWGQGAMGMMAMPHLVGERFNFAGFVDQISPRSAKLQTIDLAMKLVVELVAYTKIHGLPDHGISDFAGALPSYSDESAMRMAALVCFDGILPLGPEFMHRTTHAFNTLPGGELANSHRYQQVAGMIPGSDTAQKLEFMQQSLNAVSAWMIRFTTLHGLTTEKVLQSLRSWIDFSSNQVEHLAAFLDMTINYYEHTGIQTIARHLVQRASVEA